VALRRARLVAHLARGLRDVVQPRAPDGLLIGARVNDGLERGGGWSSQTLGIIRGALRGCPCGLSRACALIIPHIFPIYCRPKEADVSHSTFLNKIKAALSLFDGGPKAAGHGDVGNDERIRNR